MSLQQKQKTANLLSICIKAGKTVKGFDSVCAALKEGNACCVLTASDISEKSLKETAFMCGRYNTELVRTELTKEEIGRFTSKQTAVIAVCDEGFAGKFRQLAEENNGSDNT